MTIGAGDGAWAIYRRAGVTGGFVLDVLARCVELIEEVSGRRPRGDVAPWREASSVTASRLQEYGFTDDHSQGLRDVRGWRRAPLSPRSGAGGRGRSSGRGGTS